MRSLGSNEDTDFLGGFDESLAGGFDRASTLPRCETGAKSRLKAGAGQIRPAFQQQFGRLADVGHVHVTPDAVAFYRDGCKPLRSHEMENVTEEGRFPL